MEEKEILTAQVKESLAIICADNGLQGWCLASKAERIYKLVFQGHQKFGTTIPLTTIELGVFGGRSLVSMALAHRKLQNGYAIGFDSWDKITATEGSNSPENTNWWANVVPIMEVYKSFVAFVVNEDLHEYCRWLQTRSDMAAGIFKDESVSILHQDSNHCYEVIVKELELFSPKIRPGGFWIADDTNWVEAKEGYAKLPEFGFKLLETHTAPNNTEYAIYQKAEGGKKLISVPRLPISKDTPPAASVPKKSEKKKPGNKAKHKKQVKRK